MKQNPLNHLSTVLVLVAGVTAGLVVNGAEKLARLSDKELVTQYSVKITSTKDGSSQDALFYCPPEVDLKKSGPPMPLLVGLHTWSVSFSMCAKYIPDCQERKWVFVAPNFRGGNSRPTACASELAIQDVIDAVNYAKQNARVDPSRIYLIGGSGGGHMALMMAAKAPEIWAGVSAWVPISDLAAWHRQTRDRGLKYAALLEKCCGGPPGPLTAAEYRARSPINFLPIAKGLPMDLNTGIHDGHAGSVPVSQALLAFNVLATANGLPDKQIPVADIDFMVAKEKVPDALAKESQNDVERRNTVLFRRVAGAARITVFEGAHMEEQSAALVWLNRQQKGKPADFTVPAVSEILNTKRGRAVGSDEVAH